MLRIVDLTAGRCLILALTMTSLCPRVAAQATPTGQVPPIVWPTIHMTAAQDHQRMMDLLHISSIRRGADGDPKGQFPPNYDESKAGSDLKLPDPLTMKNGKKITSAGMWWRERRPEIVEDFDREVYGRAPENTPAVRWEIVSTKKETVGHFPVITKTLIGHVDNAAYPAVTVNIDLTLSTPEDAKGPVPVMMELGLSAELKEMIAKRFPDMMADAGKWREQVIAKGWGVAEYIPTSVQADNGDGLTEGIIGLANHGQPRKLDDWGVLPRGLGARAARSIISRPTMPSMRSTSASKGIRDTARLR